MYLHQRRKEARRYSAVVVKQKQEVIQANVITGKLPKGREREEEEIEEEADRKGREKREKEYYFLKQKFLLFSSLLVSVVE